MSGCYDLDSWLSLAGYEPLMDVTNESLADGNDVSSTAEEFFYTDWQIFRTMSRTKWKWIKTGVEKSTCQHSNGSFSILNGHFDH